MLYLVGRVFYFNGYAQGSPEKRINPGVSVDCAALLHTMIEKARLGGAWEGGGGQSRS